MDPRNNRDTSNVWPLKPFFVFLSILNIVFFCLSYVPGISLSVSPSVAVDHHLSPRIEGGREGGSENIHPFKTAVLFWGQTSQIVE